MQKTNIVIIILVLVIAFLLIQNVSLKNSITGAVIVNDADVISKLEQFEELKEKQLVEIKKLMEPELSKLKQEQPVIYKDTKQGDYLVKYSDRWIVYDYENNKIIRDFVIQNIELGK